MQQQHGQHGATLASPERYMPGPVKGLQRAKNAEVHARRIRAAQGQRYRAVTALSLCRNRPGGPCLQMALRLTTQEAVMGQVIPRQHPAVVLRSQYKAVLAMLCVALVAIVALAATLVIVANDDDPDHGLRSAERPAAADPAARHPLRRRPDEGTRGIQAAPPAELAPGTRFDGGPDEGTAARSPTGSRTPRSSYQPAPDEGSSPRRRPVDAPERPRAADGDQQHPGARP